MLPFLCIFLCKFLFSYAPSLKAFVQFFCAVLMEASSLGSSFCLSVAEVRQVFSDQFPDEIYWPIHNEQQRDTDQMGSLALEDVNRAHQDVIH